MDMDTFSDVGSPSTFSVTVITGFMLLVPFVSWLVHRVQQGYREFLALGPGGTPSTFAGYIRVSILRIFALKDPFSPPSIPENLRPQSGILKDLPIRDGPRPKIAGIAPQRQTTQRGTPEMYEMLCEEIKTISRCNADRLYLGTSCFEKHSTGLFSLSKLDSRPTCNGEVCHSHPSDGSMHLTLHPADVRYVIERGWGERHPLARDSWWWPFRFVPPGFVMIYAPRTVGELECVTKIIHAASWWVSGMEPRRTGEKQTVQVEVGHEGGRIVAQQRRLLRN
ncbi:hypothetical protein VTO42DRAFT_1482 [Malbranchea cinnamomea]